MEITTRPDQADIWLAKLNKKLNNHTSEIEKYERYYEGEHNLRFATRKFREAFGALFREFSDNWCAVVVDATTERMRIEGFHFPQSAPTEAGSNEGGTTQGASDPEAWEMWQRNSLDLYSDIAHEQALIAGHSYLLVGPPVDGSENPLITVEHPLEVTTLSRPGAAHIRSAGLKRWYDEDTEHFMATMYLPDSVWKYESAEASNEPSGIQDAEWIYREDPEVQAVIANPFEGIVPVVPLVCRMKLNGHGRSEIKDVIPMQDAINKLFNDAIVASEFTAFRQRILTGMEVPEDENGNIIPDFDLKASVQRLMLIKDKDVGVHEFQVSDLSQYVNLIVLARDHIAARTRTPPQYLIGEVVNVSGDALKAAESGLVNKVRRRSRFMGEGWEEAMRLGFFLKGDMARAESYGAETIWANPEITTESALADSLVKYATLGIPPQALWKRMGASQAEIAEWTEMLTNSPVPLLPQAMAAVIRAGGMLAE